MVSAYLAQPATLGGGAEEKGLHFSHHHPLKLRSKRMNLPLVTVTWEDHNFTFGDVVPKGISRVTTTGYLVSEDKKGIIVALSISDGQPNDMQYVDKRMLVDITHITFNK